MSMSKAAKERRKTDGDTLLLETPKTCRERTAKASEACYVRRFEPRDEMP